MASSSHDTRRASSDAPECIEEIFTMERHSSKLLRPRSLIRDLKVEPHYEKVSRLPRSLRCELRDVSNEIQMSESLEEDARDVISDDPEEQLLEAIRRGATPGEVESYLNLTFQKISAGVDEEINEQFAEQSSDNQGNERDKRCALARGWVYDKALGEAKEGTLIEEFLVKKLRTDESLQRGEHCKMVDCSAARWNMVNIVVASIRWRDAAENGRVLRNEELLAIAVEYGHVRLVQQLTQMPNVDVNRSKYVWNVLSRLEHGKLYVGKLADRKSRSFNHIAFLKPIGSAARMGNVDMVMTLLACDRIDVNKGKALHWAAAMGHLNVVKELLKSQKQVDVNAVKFMPLDHAARKVRQYDGHFSPLQLASFRLASVVKALREDTRSNTENWWGAFQIATEMKHDEIVKILLKGHEVVQVEGLYRDRQVHVDAANAILVGAALIASVCRMVTTTFGIFCVLWECKH